MSIPVSITQDIVQDNIYYSEMNDFVDNIPNGERQGFWNWFTENAISYEAGLPTFECSQVKSIPGNCYDNAQTNALRLGLNYCEGAFEINGNLVLHAFNIHEGKALDFTVQCNLDEGKFNDSDAPTLYYGVVIPAEFLKQHFEPELSHNHNPLIGKYFRDLTHEADFA